MSTLVDYIHVYAHILWILDESSARIQWPCVSTSLHKTHGKLILNKHLYTNHLQVLVYTAILECSIFINQEMTQIATPDKTNQENVEVYYRKHQQGQSIHPEQLLQKR